ncbi:glycosyltransferase [Methanococcoides sp. SA1]|nr:glycosyltransferase [Methanococcoides sp. SA1]
MIIFALPAYNEENNIGPLLERIDFEMKTNNYEFRIIVVNDGSKDKTLDVLNNYSGPIKVVTHEKNMGLPQTIYDALKEATCVCQENDVIITMDADNTHDPSHVQQMIEKIDNGCDVVVASRYENGGEEIGLSFKRRFLSRSINTILKITLPVNNIKDYTCGYRAYRCNLLKNTFDHYGDNLVESQSFVCMAEILIKMRKLKPIGGEIPLILRYDRKIGVSKMDIRKTIIEYISMIAKNV